VGLAALAGSAVTGIWALSLNGDLSDSCAEGNCPSGTGEDIDRMETLAVATDVLLVVGAALTVAGGVLIVIDQTSETSVGLSVGPGTYGASFRQSF
jgi:hypothetical protein